MPYIKQELRNKLDVEIAALADKIREVSDEDSIEGCLNYSLTRVLTQSFAPKGAWRYKTINRAVGVLNCVLQEFYRRLASPYEDEAITNNGDISEYSKQV